MLEYVVAVSVKRLVNRLTDVDMGCGSSVYWLVDENGLYKVG